MAMAVHQNKKNPNRRMSKFKNWLFVLFGHSQVRTGPDSRPRPIDPEHGFTHFSGTGLAFIAVADAIAVMPGGPFWAVLFFLMLLTLGLGSAFGTLEGFITPMFNLLGKIL